MPVKRGSSVTDPIACYVSPDGNDAWSGAAPERAGRRGPFATLDRAMRELARLASPKGVRRPVSIVLRGGTHFLTKPLHFNGRNTGRAAKMQADRYIEPRCPVVFKAYENEQPILSGGARIDGLEETTLHGKRAWTARIPQVAKGKWYFSQLFVNGQRRYRPRVPAEGVFHIAGLEPSARKQAWNQGQTAFYFSNDDVKPYTNLADVEFVPTFQWVDDHVPLTRVDVRRKRVEISRRSCYHLADAPVWKMSRYYLDNVFEALTQPGQWYLDRPTGRLWYLPLPDERLEDACIIAPRLSELVVVEKPSKAGDKAVEALDFDGITFAHNEWRLPPNLDGVERGQGMPEAPAAVMVHGAIDCRFVNCTFTHTANYGLDVRDGSHDIAIERCRFVHTGAGGLRIWHGCHRNVVADCEIAHIGEMFPSGIGIMVGQSGGNKIIHNHIHHVCYSAISVGWCWGYVFDRRACGNVIEYNHIHDVGMHKLADMGAIYMLGIATGTRVRFNLIHDVDSAGYGGWGIYPDEGSTDVLIENNLTYRTSSSGFNQTFGKNNLVRNNIFAFGNGSQIMQTRGENHLTVSFENNIFYFEEGEVLGGHGGVFMAGNSRPETVGFRANLYYARRGAPVFEKQSFSQWQARGFDQGGAVADPLFVDPDTGDFRLRPNSPAFAMGFRDFDLSTVGPRPAKDL